MIKRLPGVETPADLVDELNKLGYGYPYKGKMISPKEGDKMGVYYKSIPPEKFIKLGGGVCWDYVEYEAAYFDAYFKYYSYELYYIEAENNTGDPMTHTWLLYQEGTTFNIIESSWGSMSGIHRYKSKLEAISDYSRLWLKQIGHNTRTPHCIFKYQRQTKFGLNYRDVIMHYYSGILVKDVKGFFSNSPLNKKLKKEVNEL